MEAIRLLPSEVGIRRACVLAGLALASTVRREAAAGRLMMATGRARTAGAGAATGSARTIGGTSGAGRSATNGGAAAGTFLTAATDGGAGTSPSHRPKATISAVAVSVPPHATAGLLKGPGGTGLAPGASQGGNSSV